MRITGIEAKNIGPFEDLNIKFKPKPAGMENKAEIHILTGENGTGKSTILMALASFADDNNDESIRERMVYSIGYPSGYPDSQSKNTESFFELYYEDKQIIEVFSPFLRVFPTFMPNKSTEKIARFNNGSVKAGKYVEKNQKEYFLPLKHNFNIESAFFCYSGYRITSGKGLVNIKEITSNPLENAVSFEKSIDSDLILDWIANSKTKELIAKEKGISSGGYTSTVQKIEKALSDITGKKIEFDLEESLKVTLKVNKRNLSFEVLPDGLKSIISWLSDLLMRLDRINWADKSKSILEQNFILFLDEIEVHLHPSWQRKILPVVQDLFPNAQIFISTHSPFVVGSVDGARVYKFKLDENNNSVLEKEYLTEDGHSYQYYLRTGFDIESDFGLKNEIDLKKFMSFKEQIIKGDVVDMKEFEEVVNKLENQTGELSSIIGFEKRKLEKYLNKNLATA